MGSRLPWWCMLMIPNWVGKWALQKWEPPCRKTYTGWKGGLIRKHYQDRSKDLHLGKHCLGVQHRLHSNQLGEALWKGTWGSRWTTGSMWLNSVLLQQRKPTGLWIASRRASPAEIKKSLSNSIQSWSGQTWNTVFSFGHCYRKKMCTGWRRSREGPQQWSKDWEACRLKKGWENWICLALTKEGLRETLSPCSSI